MYSTPAASSSRPTDLPSLTPLRGLAALWVIFYHFTWQYFPQLNSEAFTQAIAKGYLAVDLFFLLSGFVLTHVYLATFQQGATARDYRAFLAARVARVYPLHLFVLAAFVIAEFVFAHGRAVMPLDGPLSVTAIFANIFMLQGLDALRLSWNYPAWSISLEFAAYLVFPLVLPLLCQGNRLRRVVVAAGCAAIVAWLAFATEDGLNQWSGSLALARCLPEFFLGSLAYGIYRSGRWAIWLQRDTTLLVTVTALALMLHSGVHDALIVPLFVLLILSAVSNRGRGAAWLNCRPLAWLGDVSYSTYLLHGFMLYLAGRALPYLFSTVDPGQLSFAQAALTAAAMLGATLLAAAWTYRIVELKGRTFLRARLSRPAPRQVAPANRAAFT